MARRIPSRRLPAGLEQHPLADRLDEPALLGQRDELHGRHQPQLRMLPAHQRLDPAQTAVGQRHLRLVVQAQLVALHRLAQLAEQFEALAHALVHRLGPVLEAVAPQRLGPVHGGVGLAEQGLAVGAVARKQCRPGAGGDEQFVPVHPDGFGHRLQNAAGNLFRLLAQFGPGQHHGELVAAQARHDVGLAHLAVQAVGDLLEQVVAHGVAEGVVDQLEIVEVDEQHGGNILVAPCLRDDLFEAHLEQHAVGEPGEFVAVRAQFQFLLEGDALADVVHDPDVVADAAALVRHRREMQFVPERGAVLAVVAQCHHAGLAMADELAQLVDAGLVALLALQEREVAPLDFLEAVAGDGGEGRIGVDQRVIRPAGVGDHDPFVRGFQGAAADAQHCGAFAPQGDVAKAQHRAGKAAARAQDGRGAQLHRKKAAVGAPEDLVPRLEAAAAAQQPEDAAGLPRQRAAVGSHVHQRVQVRAGKLSGRIPEQRRGRRVAESHPAVGAEAKDAFGRGVKDHAVFAVALDGRLHEAVEAPFALALESAQHLPETQAGNDGAQRAEKLHRQAGRFLEPLGIEAARERRVERRHHQPAQHRIADEGRARGRQHEAHAAAVDPGFVLAAVAHEADAGEQRARQGQEIAACRLGVLKRQPARQRHAYHGAERQKQHPGRAQGAQPRAHQAAAELQQRQKGQRQHQRAQAVERGIGAADDTQEVQPFVAAVQQPEQRQQPDEASHAAAVANFRLAQYADAQEQEGGAIHKKDQRHVIGPCGHVASPRSVHGTAGGAA